jgi:hypothetical protein
MTFALLALMGLVLLVTTSPIPGGVLFAPLPLGLFLVGLTGLLAGAEDNTVPQGGGVVQDPRRWRNGL